MQDGGKIVERAGGGEIGRRSRAGGGEEADNFKKARAGGMAEPGADAGGAGGAANEQQAAARFQPEDIGLQINGAQGHGQAGVDGMNAQDGAGYGVQLKRVKQAQQNRKAQDAATGGLLKNSGVRQADELAVKAGEIQHENPHRHHEHIEPGVGPKHVKNGEVAGKEPHQHLVGDKRGQQRPGHEQRIHNGGQFRLEFETSTQHGFAERRITGGGGKTSLKTLQVFA